MRQKADLVGKRFGKLIVLEDDGTRQNSNVKWKCQCDCGNITYCVGYALKNGSITSCGCFRKEDASNKFSTHKLSSTKEYKTWLHMKSRCYNPNNIEYCNYGGRGICIEEPWLSDFNSFYEDMGKCPNGYSIDRINNDGNYCKENCRWATREEQMNNMTTNKYIQINNKNVTVSQLAKTINISPFTIYTKLRRNQSIQNYINEYVRITNC